MNSYLMRMEMIMKTTLQQAVNQILFDTDELTIRDIWTFIEKMRDNGFEDETIIDELLELRRRLNNNNG